LRGAGINDFHIGEVLDKACKMNGYKDIYAYYDHYKTGDYGIEETIAPTPRGPDFKDWQARKLAIQQQLSDPKQSKDPATRAAFFKKMAQLNSEGERYGIKENSINDPKLVSGPGERA
jgi:hypothetical protein